MMNDQGVPYTVSELKSASDQPLDEYHRELMQWAAGEIERLQNHIMELGSYYEGQNNETIPNTTDQSDT